MGKYVSGPRVTHSHQVVLGWRPSLRISESHSLPAFLCHPLPTPQQTLIDSSLQSWVLLCWAFAGLCCLGVKKVFGSRTGVEAGWGGLPLHFLPFSGVFRGGVCTAKGRDPGTKLPLSKLLSSPYQFCVSLSHL